MNPRGMRGFTYSEFSIRHIAAERKVSWLSIRGGAVTFLGFLAGGRLAT